MSKHTPGPWVWHEDGNLYSAPQMAALEHEARTSGSSGYPEPIIVTDSGVYPPKEEDKPLIAAAPLLLRAAQAFVEWADGPGHESTCPAEIQTAMRSAVKAATDEAV